MPRRIALIVGVSQYQAHTGLHNLSAPVNDAQRVYEVLAEYGGFDMLYPLPLADGKVGSSGEVQAQELQARLRELLNPQAGEEVELAVFYFSGHGVNPGGQVVYLSTSDEGLAIAVPWLADLAKNSAAQNICIWLDCCHSGEILEFVDFNEKGFCVVAASHAEGEALAINGGSLLTNLLCAALTPGVNNQQEIRVLDFIHTVKAGRRNLPQQILCRWGDTPFTLTQLKGEVTVESAYPPDHPPYKGLLPFRTKEDAEFFFGREGMIQQLLDRLSISRFVPLLGASGSGKSSLVLAGLLPQLSTNDWQVLVMRPTTQPLQNLRDTLVRGFPGAQVGTLATGADLQREVSALVTAGKRLLLVIDQFEEVFTECRDDAARAVFFACLLEALDNDNPLHLVLTLRADFLGHCTEQAYSGLGQRLQHHALLLVAPTAGELREAITRPLALVGMRCEQALEDELVDQTLHAKGSLPLLQYVLEKLWQSARQERSRELTLAMYQQLGGQHGGGLRGVLNEKADAFYQQLEPQQQRLMEWLMVELVQVNDGQEDTRRTVTLQELHNRQPQYTEALDALLAQLATHERLLTQDHDDYGHATVTVAHETLIRDWQRLRSWLESNREIKSWRLRLEDSITAWKNNVSGSLLREKRLAEAQHILDKYPKSLLIGQNEKAFINASQREALRTKQLRVGAMLVFIIILLAGIAATTFQWRQAEQQRLVANHQAKLALINSLTAQSSQAVQHPSPQGTLVQGVLLAIQSFNIDKSSIKGQASLSDGLQSLGHLKKVFYGYGSDLASLTFGNHTISLNKDEGKIIGIGDDGYLDEWDINTGERTNISWSGSITPHSSLSLMKFNSNGSKIVSGEYVGHSLRVWDGVAGKEIVELKLGESTNKTTEISSDGTRIITVDHNNMMRLYSSSTGEVIGGPWSYKGNIDRVVFSQDGNYLISWGGLLSDKALQLWNMATGQPVGEPWHIKEGIVTSASFSSDTTLAVNSVFLGNSLGNFLYLWNVKTGELIGSPWADSQEGGTATTFSADARYVVSGSFDNTLRLWDVKTGKVVGNPWIGHEAPIESIISSPDNQYVVSSSPDKTIRLWSMANDQSLSDEWHGHEGSVSVVKFTPDGNHLRSGGIGVIQTFGSIIKPQVVGKSGDGTLRLWNTTTGQSEKTIWNGFTGKETLIVFSQDAKMLISSIENGLQLWDTTTGQPIGIPWTGTEFQPICAAFSPDSKQVVSGDTNNTLRLWDVATGKMIGTSWQGRGQEIKVIAFSPDGKKVIIGESGGSLLLWDVATGKTIGTPWQGHTKEISAVAFSPDGKRVISGSQDGSLRLWDVATGQTIGVPWIGHNYTVTAAAFSPDGKFVASGGLDTTVRLWDVASGQPIGKSWHGHKSLVRALDFSPDGKNLVSGSDDATLRYWSVDPQIWAKKACSIVNRNFSLAEWQRFIGDALPYEKTCPDLPAPGEEGWVEPYAGG